LWGESLSPAAFEELRGGNGIAENTRKLIRKKRNPRKSGEKKVRHGLGLEKKQWADEDIAPDRQKEEVPPWREEGLKQQKSRFRTKNMPIIFITGGMWPMRHTEGGAAGGIFGEKKKRRL